MQISNTTKRSGHTALAGQHAGRVLVKGFGSSPNCRQRSWIVGNVLTSLSQEPKWPKRSTLSDFLVNLFGVSVSRLSISSISSEFLKQTFYWLQFTCNSNTQLGRCYGIARLANNYKPKRAPEWPAFICVTAGELGCEHWLPVTGNRETSDTASSNLKPIRSLFWSSKSFRSLQMSVSGLCPFWNQIFSLPAETLALSDRLQRIGTELVLNWYSLICQLESDLLSAFACQMEFGLLKVCDSQWALLMTLAAAQKERSTQNL